MSFPVSPVQAQLFINGCFVESSGAERQVTVSPATGEAVGDFPLGTAADVDRAVAAAGKAFDAWSGISVFERCEYLERLIVEIRGRREELGRLLAIEQGKPYLREALPEVDEAVNYIRVAIEIAKHLDAGTILPLAAPGRRAFTYRVPRGVVATIQPWNFPLGTAAAQIAPALVMGNTVLALPAPSTTLIEYEWTKCFEAAGFPPGVFNLLTGHGAVVGEAMTGHSGVQVVAFTGSVVTGQRVAARAAGKPQLIELGGNGPFIVLGDADLDRVIPDAVESAFSYAGQSCIAAGRFLVEESVYDDFAARLVEAVNDQVRLGHPFDETTTMGPLNNATLAAKVDGHVTRAVQAGAKVLTGGGRAKGMPTELYWEPTVLVDVEESMSVAVEETFGPIAPIQRISSDREALDLMKVSPYGLASAVYTRDVLRGLRLGEQAPTGVMNVNAPPGAVEIHIPIGGFSGKLSGIGRIQGRYPMEEIFTETKVVTINVD